MKNPIVFYLLIGSLFVGMLYVNAQYFNGSTVSRSHIGITYSKDFKITSEKSGTIKTIPVVPGQQVKQGDLLVKMENNSLEIDIAKLANKIKVLKKEKQEKAALVQSKIAYLKAESGIKLGEIESEIEQINSELQMNRELTEQFYQVKNTETSTPQNNLQEIRINALEQGKKLNNEAVSIKIQDILKSHQTDIMVLENEIGLMEQEMKLLLNQKEQLTKYANFNGVVEFVYVRPGEEVEPFTPILTINPTQPSSTVAYMVGAKVSNLTVGSKVTVSSYNHRNTSVEGEIIGFGSIAELPEILQKSTAVKAFGTEVFIQIPEKNNFVKGEKVLIK